MHLSIVLSTLLLIASINFNEAKKCQRGADVNPCQEAFGLLQKGANPQQIKDALVQLLHDRGCYTDYKPTGTYPSSITGFSNAIGSYDYGYSNGNGYYSGNGGNGYSGNNNNNNYYGANSNQYGQNQNGYYSNGDSYNGYPSNYQGDSYNNGNNGYPSSYQGDSSYGDNYNSYGSSDYYSGSNNNGNNYYPSSYTDQSSYGNDGYQQQYQPNNGYQQNNGYGYQPNSGYDQSYYQNNGYSQSYGNQDSYGSYYAKNGATPPTPGPAPGPHPGKMQMKEAVATEAPVVKRQAEEVLEVPAVPTTPMENQELTLSENEQIQAWVENFMTATGIGNTGIARSDAGVSDVLQQCSTIDAPTLPAFLTAVQNMNPNRG